MVSMEVCANSVESAIEAQKGGALRVELCDNLLEGGTTASYAQIKLTKELVSISVYPIIRPRGGDFLYSELEFELMKTDIATCKKLNCEGVVFGILTASGEVDFERCKVLLAHAKPMKATFHRAFDMVNDQFKALEQIIELGFERILTSGAETSALEGAERIEKLIQRSGGRIVIMPGAGISIHNIAELIAKTGAKEFHGSAKAPVASAMTYCNPKLNMGGNRDEFVVEVTSALTVKNLIELANSAE
ncbi:MAG: copper homeostasis protein CutC [Bacteroidota bacterium]